MEYEPGGCRGRWIWVLKTVWGVFFEKGFKIGFLKTPPHPAALQIAPDISLSTTYKQTAPGEVIGHCYSRCGNPTRDVLEKNLACLESAKYCRVFSSGMSTVMV